MKLIHIVVVIWCVAYTEAGCPTLRITGTVAQYGAGGQFTQVTQMCSGRPAYRQVGDGRVYLYYNEDLALWVVSNVVCDRFGFIRGQSTASNPEDVAVMWEETQDGTWTDNNQLRVICDPGFEGCEDIVISDTDIHTNEPGTYKRLSDSDMCHGRYSYEHISGNYYLFNLLGYWLVGPDLCAVDYNIRINDGAFYPEQITNKAEEFDPVNATHGFWRESGLQINCKYSTVARTTVLTTRPPAKPGCPALRVGGTTLLHDYVGRYEMLPASSQCSNRRAYKQVDAENHLFYMASVESWVFGPQLCVLTSAINAPDTADNPEDVSSSWLEAATSSRFEVNDEFEVECDNSFGGCVEILLFFAIANKLDYEGRYKVIDNEDAMCHGRYSYQHVEKDYYAYAGAGRYQWYVGTKLCGESGDGAIVRWRDGAFFPEDLTKRSGQEFRADKTSTILRKWETSPIQFSCKVGPRASDAVMMKSSVSLLILMAAMLLFGFTFQED